MKILLNGNLIDTKMIYRISKIKPLILHKTIPPFEAEFRIYFINYFWSIYILGPIVVDIATLFIYCPFAAAGLALIIAFIITS